MSKAQTITQADIREQFRQTTEPWEKSAQAHGKPNGPRHNDGETIYQDWHTPPLWKAIRKLAKRKHQVAEYPGALLDTIVHVTDDDLERLESGDEFAEQPETRRKVLQWFQESGRDGRPRYRELHEGGTDCHVYGEPRSGKTTLGHNFVSWLMQVNNETNLWAETIGDDGTIDRTQWLAFAPYATLMLPQGLDVEAEVVPDNPALQRFPVPVEDLARDVKRYQGPRDLHRQLQPGQFYVVVPDPLFRGCEQLTRFNYTSAWDASDPAAATPQSHWWFAAISNRISERKFNHWTSYHIDEAGNWLEEEASKDDHDTLQKISFLQRNYADAAKHKVSLYLYTHAMVEIHHKIRRKIRWWLTMNGSKVPVGESLPGDKQAPQAYSRVPTGKGQGQIWTPRGYYANVAPTNTNRFVPLQGDIVLKFPEVAEAYA